MTNADNRRPIAQRETGWAKALASALVKSDITPNQISAASMLFAAWAGLCFAAIGFATGVDRVLLCLGAALGCQLRLLANMMDGMVAVEGGKGGPTGPIWNEAPDRFSDIFVLVGAGYGVAAAGLADPSLGWAAAVAAVMTAYVREVAHGAGAPNDFIGPMAKPHRMFAMTMAALLTIVDGPIGGPWIEYALNGDRGGDGAGAFLELALWIALIGSVFTTLRRLMRALKHLRANR